MVEREIDGDSDENEQTPRVSEVTANLGDREFDKGKSKVTTDIFDGGKDKLKNAEAFIENLEKTRRRHITQKKTGPVQKSELELLLDAESPRLTEEVLTTQGFPDEDDNVIMDINHRHFKKKDHIFMDFFSMYGKNFIADKRQQEPEQPVTPLGPEATVETPDLSEV